MCPASSFESKTPHRAARHYAAGVEDLATGTALRPNAQFRIGSITKTFVATIVLQLVGEGRLSLDEPVAQRLPRLLSNGARITVRQLLNHSSGLPDYTNDPELLAGIVQNRVWHPRELIAIAAEAPAAVYPRQRLVVLQHQLHRGGSAHRSGYRPPAGP